MPGEKIRQHIWMLLSLKVFNKVIRCNPKVSCIFNSWGHCYLSRTIGAYGTCWSIIHKKRKVCDPKEVGKTNPELPGCHAYSSGHFRGWGHKSPSSTVKEWGGQWVSYEVSIGEGASVGLGGPTWRSASSSKGFAPVLDFGVQLKGSKLFSCCLDNCPAFL